MSANEDTPLADHAGSNGIWSWITKLTTMERLKSNDACASRSLVRSSGNNRGAKCTVMAPTVSPNSAMDTAIKAKWYHIVTLNIRVSRISYISVLSVVRNSPP